MRAGPGLPVPPPYAGPAVRPSLAVNLFWHYPDLPGFPAPPLYDGPGPAARPSFTQHAVDAFWHYPGMQGALITVAVIVFLYAAAKVAGYCLHRARITEVLPGAPERHEHFSYFQKQWRRSLTVMYALLSTGGLYGLWTVFIKSWVWYPFLASLIIMVPWTAYTIAVALRRPVISMDTHNDVVSRPGYPGSADVFITVCGEDRGVVGNTFAHVARLHWPGKLAVYVLDDSADESLRGLAGEYGFTYLRRPDRPAGKKSGNLNHGLSRSGGDFVAVFDADFSPAPSFLLQTIPYFSEPDVGIVQTSQYFSIDRRGTVNWMARLSGVVQGMFFAWNQPGQQSRNAAFCVGTNVLYRRSALQAAGGIPWCPSGGEDVVTSVRLLAAGMRTVYVPLNLARGLCPDTFAGVISQQYRWCLSTIALIFPVRGMERADRGFWACRMTLAQRVSYLSGLLYYGQSLLVLVISVTPALLMLWEYPYQVGPGNYLPIAPGMLSMMTLPLMVPGWRPEMLRLSLVYAVAHLLAFADAVTGRVQGWVPSGAAAKVKKNRNPVRASVILRAWVAITQALTWWALALDIPVYGLPAYWIPAGLAAMQTVVLLPLLLPGYGATGLNMRRVNAYLVRNVHRPGRAARPVQVDVLRQSGRRRQSGIAVLRAGSGVVQPRRAGHHRKPRQRDLRRMERPQPVPFRQGLDEG